MIEYYDEACAVVSQPVKDRQGGQPTFWRLDEPVISVDSTTGKRVVVKGGLFPAQREWWEAEEFVKLLVGGYGAGKTLALCKRVAGLALANAPAPVAIVSPTFPLARHTVVSTMMELLAGKQALLGRSFWWRFNSTNHEFRIRYRGRSGLIIVYSGEYPDRLKGPNLAAAGIDEPFIQDEAVFTQMLARVRHPGATRSELLLTGTPEQLNWGYEVAQGEWQEKLAIKVVTASTRRNQALQTDYIQRLEATFDGRAGQAYISGQFINLTEGQVYHAFDPAVNSVSLETPDNVPFGAGMDFNVNPMSAAVFWRAGDHVHFFDEFELRNSDTEYMAQVLREKYGSRLETIYPDATGNARKTSAPGGRTDFYYLGEAGFDVDAPFANPKQRDRHNAINGKFKAANGKVSLTVCPKGCPKLTKYLRIYSHALKNKQEEMSHLLDAFGYPVARLFPIVGETIRESKLTGH